MKDQLVYLVHILECIQKIDRYVSEGREVFFASDGVQDAVLRNLQVMCESTQMLAGGWRALHSEVDWRRVADFRNRLVHDYLGVDLEIVWKVVMEDLPVLKRVIGAAIDGAEIESPR